MVTALTARVVPATPFPSPGTFARWALPSLGHSPHTCGYWGHSLHRLLCSWLLPSRLTPVLMRALGWGQWRWALAKAKQQ